MASGRAIIVAVFGSGSAREIYFAMCAFEDSTKPEGFAFVSQLAD
jgi:hypothetical protein